MATADGTGILDQLALDERFTRATEARKHEIITIRLLG